MAYKVNDPISGENQGGVRLPDLGLTSGSARTVCRGEYGLGWHDAWVKGGLPDALRGDFRAWWEAYLRTVPERDLPQYGVRADPLFQRRLLTMLAHLHGGLLNASQLGSSLGVSHHAVQRYLAVLEQVFLIRRLAELFNHPSRGASWEGFVIEDIVRRERIAHPRSQAYFWRTAAGAEVDLLLDRGNERVAIEVKASRGDDARVVRTLREALPDIGARHARYSRRDVRTRRYGATSNSGCRPAAYATDVASPPLRVSRLDQSSQLASPTAPARSRPMAE